MAEWHLRELRNALEAKGWRILAEHPGDERGLSATWEIERSTKKPSVFIDFEGLDDLITLPLEQSYACNIRGNRSSALYFSRKGSDGSRRRENWRDDLQQFLIDLETVAG